MNISGSPDISVLQVQVTYDISGVNPLVSLVNLSAGNNLANVSWAFIVQSPAGSYINNGDINNPDIVGEWSDYVISNPWPKPNNRLEWSGAPYQFTVIAKDSNGNVYTAPVQVAYICAPPGNLPTSKNPYGLAMTYVQVRCQQARIYFENKTNSLYQGNTGTLVSSVLRVIYPIDPDMNIPVPFTISNFSGALVPISYSSKNYQFSTSIVYDYDLGDYVIVRIKYQNLVTFPVLCDIDLGPLVCEIDQLVKDIESGNCSDVAAANEKLRLITPKLQLAFIGIMQPLTGVDVPRLIEEIEAIGGWDCDCCNAPTGIIPVTASVIDGYTFSVISEGGDIAGDINQAGTNIQILLHDVSYIFKICAESPSSTTAFEVIPSVSSDGFTKTYCLRVDKDQLALEILTAIQESSSLLNLLNSLINQQSANFNLFVDGKCIFQSTSSYDYVFGLSGIPATTTYAILSGINIGGNVQALSYNFNLTNLSGLQSYLNNLGLGTFVVTDLGSGNISISSTANTNDIQALLYMISSTVFQAVMTKTASGYIAKSANEVVQLIINYLCGLTDAQIVTSTSYEICYIDSDGAKQTVIVEEGTSLTSAVTEILARECETIDYIISIGAVTCASIRSKFPASIAIMQADDIILGTKAGACAQIGPVEFGLAMMNLGSYNQEFVNAFCLLIQQCNGGLPCEPYTLLQATVTPFDDSCPDVVSFGYSFSGSTLSIDNVGFGNVPSGNQTVKIEYKLTSSSVYTVLNAAATILPNGTPTVSQTAVLSAGQAYDIRITNNCSSPAAPYVNTVNVPGSTQTVKIDSTVGVAQITGVTGITGFSFVGPVYVGHPEYGIHSAFTGIIGFTITGTPPLASNMTLLKNGTPLECVDFSSAGVYAFASHAFLSTDVIWLQANTGACT